MRSGTVLLDFQSRPGERIDSILTRFDTARQEAARVGAAITNYRTLTTILLRAIGVNGMQTIHLFQPTGKDAGQPATIRCISGGNYE